MRDRRGKLFALYFLLGIAVLVSIWFIPSSRPASVRVAAIGGTLAFFGVILMAIPVLRVGPLQWIADLATEGTRKYFEYEKKPPTELERREIEDQRTFDLLMQNIVGPYLIGIGTFINGISGFF